METWKKQSWVQRGRDPEDPGAYAYDDAVAKLSAANPPTLEDAAADEACEMARARDTGEDILRVALELEGQ